MKVKIANPTHWEGKRYEAGSVIEVPAETYERNSSWMKATDEPLDSEKAEKPKSEKGEK